MKQFIVFSLIAITSFACFGQDVKSNTEVTKSFEFIATVNGVPITKGLFDLNLQAAITQGQKDSPQLREAIKNELINRELISQEVVKQGIDKELDLRDQITQLRQNIYLQAFVEEHFKKNPITTEQLMEEYNKQKQVLLNAGSVQSSKIPSFEASQNQLKQALIQQYLVQTVKRLRESSRIIQ